MVMVKCLPKFNISQSMVAPNCFRSHKKLLMPWFLSKKKKSDVQSEIHLVQSNISTRQSARALKKVSSGFKENLAYQKDAPQRQRKIFMV